MCLVDIHRLCCWNIMLPNSGIPTNAHKDSPWCWYCPAIPETLLTVGGLSGSRVVLGTGSPVSFLKGESIASSLGVPCPFLCSIQRKAAWGRP